MGQKMPAPFDTSAPPAFTAVTQFPLHMIAAMTKAQAQDPIPRIQKRQEALRVYPENGSRCSPTLYR